MDLIPVDTIAPHEIFYDFFDIVAGTNNSHLMCIEYEDLIIYPYLGKITKNGKDIIGYKKFDGYFIKYRQKGIHRIIFEAFYNVTLGPNDTIIHLNGCRTDNRITNLKWRAREIIKFAPREQVDK